MATVKSVTATIDPDTEPITVFDYEDARKCMNITEIKDAYEEMKKSFIVEEERYFCLNPTRNGNMENTFGDRDFILYNFEIYYCVNTTENNNHCYS